MSEWDDDADEYAPTFVLSPVDDDVFVLAMEKWEIWRRWETAHAEGRASVETHPALPADRARHDELQPILRERLAVHPEASFRARGEFRRARDPDWNGKGWPPLEVRWDAYNP